MTELLEIEELEAGYDEALVLRGVSLRVGADQIVSIIGPNGAGKSTLLKAVYGLVRPRAGRVLFAGQDVTGTIGSVSRTQRKGEEPSPSHAKSATSGCRYPCGERKKDSRS